MLQNVLTFPFVVARWGKHWKLKYPVGKIFHTCFLPKCENILAKFSWSVRLQSSLVTLFTVKGKKWALLGYNPKPYIQKEWANCSLEISTPICCLCKSGLICSGVACVVSPAKAVELNSILNFKILNKTSLFDMPQFNELWNILLVMNKAAWVQIGLMGNITLPSEMSSFMRSEWVETWCPTIHKDFCI